MKFVLSFQIFCSLVWALKPYEREMIDLYKRVSPSVVSVNTTTLKAQSFFNVVPEKGSGSGVVIDENGYILTNYHVVGGARQIQVSFGDQGPQYPAKLIGISPRHDLAVIQVNAPQTLLHPAAIGDSDLLEVGQSAIAIGNPFGVLGRTMTTGIVSALGRNIDIGDTKLFDLIQTDAPINPGNSGGALVNSDGEVIGINTLIFSQSGGSVGIGFAIPINTAVKFLPELINKGKVGYPLLGVSCLPLDKEFSQRLGIQHSEGLLIVQVVEGSAAAKYGLKAGQSLKQIGPYRIPIDGDILLSIDGYKLRTSEDLTEFLKAKKRVGEKARLELIRKGKTLQRDVVLGER